jgi:hypothetical protein
MSLKPSDSEAAWGIHRRGLPGKSGAKYQPEVGEQKVVMSATSACSEARTEIEKDCDAGIDKEEYEWPPVRVQAAEEIAN